jgi:hypothetical protein
VTTLARGRTRHAGLVSPAAEVKRLRAQLAAALGDLDTVTAERDQLAGQLAALIEATDYDLPGHWRQLASETAERAAGAARADGIERGRQLEAAERDASWHRIAVQVATGPDHSELELRRWGPGGRAHFGDSRPGDYMVGPDGGTR